MRNPYKPLEKAIGYRFRRRWRLDHALTHPSYRYEQDHVDYDNQRLEFLGDAVLGMVTGAYLFRLYPDMQEGDLTKLRSRVTSSKPLADIAESCELGPYLRLGRGEEQSGGRQRPSNLTDALEAVLGAAYEDGGIRAVEKIFHQLMVPYIHGLDHGPAIDNPKGHLQEVAQRRWHITPRYRIASEKGPSHKKIYTVDVLLREHVFGTGQGSNKRMAQAHAAREALQKVETLEDLPAEDSETA